MMFIGFWCGRNQKLKVLQNGGRRRRRKRRRRNIRNTRSTRSIRRTKKIVTQLSISQLRWWLRQLILCRNGCGLASRQWGIYWCHCWVFVCICYHFYHATRMHSADYAVATCLSVCLSIYPSHADIMCKRLYMSSKFFQHWVAPPF